MFRSGGMVFSSGKEDEGQAVPAPVKQSVHQLIDKHFFNRITTGLKIFLVMLVFSAGISTGWYYVAPASHGKPDGMQHYRIERHGSPTGFTRRTRHHAGPDRMVQHRVIGVLTGMGQNISIIFLLVFLTVMLREHFRSPDERPPRS
jgi:hypothetical protein